MVDSITFIREENHPDSYQLSEKILWEIQGGVNRFWGRKNLVGVVSYVVAMGIEVDKESVREEIRGSDHFSP